MSLPSWERGLKSNGALGSTWYGTVAPLVGAWIEMVKGGGIWAVVAVAPLVGAWIEINFPSWLM